MPDLAVRFSDYLPFLGIENFDRVETFPGAACLTLYLAFLALERISRVCKARSKAAPLQSEPAVSCFVPQLTPRLQPRLPKVSFNYYGTGWNGASSCRKTG
jgi:hypothetical protein